MVPPGSFTPPRTSARSGFSLLEITIFTAIMLMGLLAMTSTSLTVSHLSRQNAEKAAARSALQAIVEEIRGVSNGMNGADPSWSQVFLANYAPDGVVGNQFPVTALPETNGAPALCTVTIVVDETRTDADIGCRLGMPRDLDNDGFADSIDVTDSAQILPVVATVVWFGIAGEQSLSQGFYVLSY